MESKYIYSDTFAHTIKSTYGAAGTSWLERLPTLIEQCAKMWYLTDLQPVENLTYNYVLFGMRQGASVVLKLRCAVSELCKEVAALTAFQDHGGVKLLAHDEQLGALLLERALPGNTLTSYFPYDDAKATQIVAQLVHNLHQAQSAAEFSPLRIVLPDLNKNFEQLMSFLPRARDLKDRLLATTDTQVLLHGDFHHGNILSVGSDQWVVIDPEGIVGDPVYDLAVYIRNPLKELVVLSNAQEIILNRIRDFSKLLGYPEQRIYEWTFLQTVCSTYWSLEDRLDIVHHVKFLRILQGIQI